MRKKLSLLVASVFLAISMGACSSTESANEITDTTEAQTTTEAETATDNSEDSSATTTSEESIDAADAMSLMTEAAQSGEFDDSTIKQLKKLSEVDFLYNWEEVLYAEVFEEYDWNSSASQKMTNLCNLYKEVRGNTDAIDMLITNQEGLDNCQEQLEELNLEKYNFDIRGVEMQSDSFYITQRLEQGYEDNILGMIQKELDSYEEKDSSEWVAYDVGEFGLPGDNRYIIHSDELNPFPSLDVYDVYYVDLAETLTITDSKGFTADVPVFLMLSNAADLSYDLKCLYNIEEEEVRLRDEIIMQITGEGEYDPGNYSEEGYDNAAGGESNGYILEGSDSRYLSEEEVSSLSPEEIRLAKNEIYARHGRIFESEDLKEHFESQSWYYGEIEPDDFDESVLNKYEKANIDLLVEYE